MAKVSCNLDAFRHSDKPHTYAYRVLSELGFDSVEPEVMDGRCIYETYHYCPMISMDEDPAEIRRTISSYGLDVSCVSAHTSLLETEYGVRYLRKAIRFAKHLRAPIVNTSEGPKPMGISDADAFALMKHNLNEVMKTAENYDMYLTIEPHGEYTTNAEGLKRILALSRSEKLGVNFDTGNVFLAGNDPVSTLREVADRVRYVHVKDIGGALLGERGKVTGTPVGVAVGEGNVDIKSCVDVLKEVGYQGVYSIEAAEKDLAKSLSYLRTLM